MLSWKENYFQGPTIQGASIQLTIRESWSRGSSTVMVIWTVTYGTTTHWNLAESMYKRDGWAHVHDILITNVGVCGSAGKQYLSEKWSFISLRFFQDALVKDKKNPFVQPLLLGEESNDPKVNCFHTICPDFWRGNVVFFFGYSK